MQHIIQPSGQFTFRRPLCALLQPVRPTFVKKEEGGHELTPPGFEPLSRVAGEVRAVLRGVVPKAGTMPGHLDAYVLSLRFDVHNGELTIAGMRPLLLTEHPLHAVVVDPVGDGVVVAASEVPTTRAAPPEWGALPVCVFCVCV